MSSKAQSGVSAANWREYFREQVAKLHEFPEQVAKLQGFPTVTDHFSAHRPSEDVFKIAQKIVDVISREDMPLPLVGAGSDGSIEVTWRRNPGRELSCFIEPRIVMVLLVRDGEVYEGGFEEPSQINQYVIKLFE
jgi:hypothetical protein